MEIQAWLQVSLCQWQHEAEADLRDISLTKLFQTWPCIFMCLYRHLASEVLLSIPRSERTCLDRVGPSLLHESLDCQAIFNQSPNSPIVSLSLHSYCIWTAKHWIWKSTKYSLPYLRMKSRSLSIGIKRQDTPVYACIVIAKWCQNQDLVHTLYSTMYRYDIVFADMRLWISSVILWGCESSHWS